MTIERLRCLGGAPARAGRTHNADEHQRGRRSSTRYNGQQWPVYVSNGGKSVQHALLEHRRGRETVAPFVK